MKVTILIIGCQHQNRTDDDYGGEYVNMKISGFSGRVALRSWEGVFGIEKERKMRNFIEII